MTERYLIARVNNVLPWHQANEPEMAQLLTDLLAALRAAPTPGDSIDAARYRWLRQRFEAEHIYSDLIEVGLPETFAVPGKQCGPFPSCVDKAIDAAMSALEG